MRFADHFPKAWAGWAITLALTAVLVFVFQTSGAMNIPTVVRVHTDKTASSVRACLESAQGKQLLGDLSQVPPPMTGRRFGPRDLMYSTSKGHLILFQEENGETILRVKNTTQVSEGQLRFLSACSDELAMW